MRRFVLEHPTLAFVLGFIFLVIIPFAIYKVAKADDDLARKSDNRICIERNYPTYEVTHRDGNNYSHTRYYDQYYREPATYRYYNYDYDYYGSARPHGPSAWSDPGSAWGSGYNYNDVGPTPYPGPARPHGAPAW